MVAEDTYFAGLDAIPYQIPLIDGPSLAQGGTEWPGIPGCPKKSANRGLFPPPPTWDKFLADQPANSLAVIVLMGLILSLIFSILITFLALPKPWRNSRLGLPLAAGHRDGRGILSNVYRTDPIPGVLRRHQPLPGSPEQPVFQNPGLDIRRRIRGIRILLIGICWIVHRISRGSNGIELSPCLIRNIRRLFLHLPDFFRALRHRRHLPLVPHFRHYYGLDLAADNRPGPGRNLGNEASAKQSPPREMNITSSGSGNRCGATTASAPQRCGNGLGKIRNTLPIQNLKRSSSRPRPRPAGFLQDADVVILVDAVQSGEPAGTVPVRESFPKRE